MWLAEDGDGSKRLFNQKPWLVNPTMSPREQLWVADINDYGVKIKPTANFTLKENPMFVNVTITSDNQEIKIEG